MQTAILTLTYQANLNYGAALQAWALKTAIEKYTNNRSIVLPLEPEFSRRTRIKYKDKTDWISKLRKTYATLRAKYKTEVKNRNLRNSERYKHFQHFLKNFAFNGRPSFYPNNIEQEIEGIDTLFIGSDWVWHLPEQFLNADPVELPLEKAIYLGFLPLHHSSTPRLVAYAASQGIVPTSPSSLLKTALKNFSAISVREAESARYLSKNGSPIPINHTVDPTLLLEKTDLKTIERDLPHASSITKDNYILVYELEVTNNTDPLPKYAEELSKKTGLPICNISLQSDAPLIKSVPLGEQIGPMEFLGAIKNSRYVITNSFHGMVFASLYHKPFTAFQRQPNDFRQINLTRLLNMENRLLPCENRTSVDTDVDPFDIEPDWERADTARRFAAARSIDFLKRSLDYGHPSH